MSESRRSADELLEHRDDPGEWSEESEEVEVRPASEVVSFRLPPDEVDRLVEAARTSGESISEYVRKAIAVRQFGEPIGSAVEVSSSGGTLLIRASQLLGSARRDAPSSFVPDTPPATQNVA